MFKYSDLTLSEKMNSGRIHSLLMGRGKTSTITPLVVLRYIQLMTQKKLLPFQFFGDQKILLFQFYFFVYITKNHHKVMEIY